MGRVSRRVGSRRDLSSRAALGFTGWLMAGSNVGIFEIVGFIFIPSRIKAAVIFFDCHL